MTQRTIQHIIQTSTQRLSQCSDSALIDVQTLLCHVLQKNKSYLYSHNDHVLSASKYQQFDQLLQKRLQGQPIAYLTGSKEFWSLDFKVTPDVLIPRPDTEILVQAVLDQLPKDENLLIADLGTGSGAIAIALATERPHWQIIATDQSEKALVIAKKNAQTHQCDNIKFLQGDWCEALSPVIARSGATRQSHTWQKGSTQKLPPTTSLREAQRRGNLNQLFDAIISNPPYIDKNEPELKQGDVRCEPTSALIADDHGLSDIKTITEQTKHYLKPNGLLVFEHGYQQAEQVKYILKHAGFIHIQHQNDLNGHSRVTLGYQPDA